MQAHRLPLGGRDGRTLLRNRTVPGVLCAMGTSRSQFSREIAPSLRPADNGTLSLNHHAGAERRLARRLVVSAIISRPGAAPSNQIATSGQWISAPTAPRICGTSPTV